MYLTYLGTHGTDNIHHIGGCMPVACAGRRAFDQIFHAGRYVGEEQGDQCFNAADVMVDADAGRKRSG